MRKTVIFQSCFGFRVVDVEFVISGSSQPDVLACTWFQCAFCQSQVIEFLCIVWPMSYIAGVGYQWKFFLIFETKVKHFVRLSPCYISHTETFFDLMAWRRISLSLSKHAMHVSMSSAAFWACKKEITDVVSRAQDENDNLCHVCQALVRTTIATVCRATCPALNHVNVDRRYAVCCTYGDCLCAVRHMKSNGRPHNLIKTRFFCLIREAIKKIRRANGNQRD